MNSTKGRRGRSKMKVLRMANPVILIVLPGADLRDERGDGCFNELSVAAQRQRKLQCPVAF
jgi:hypothetical protein